MIAKREVDHSWFEWRDIALTSRLLDFADDLPGLRGFSAQCKHAAQSAAQHAAIGNQLNAALECSDSFLQISELLLHQPKHPVGPAEIRITLDGAVALFQGGVEFAAVEKDARSVTRDDCRNRVECL